MDSRPNLVVLIQILRGTFCLLCLVDVRKMTGNEKKMRWEMALWGAIGIPPGIVPYS